MYKIGERVRALREQRGLNQRELAEMTGLHASTVSHIEQNRRGVRVPHVLTLAQFFGVSVDELLAPVEHELA